MRPTSARSPQRRPRSCRHPMAADHRLRVALAGDGVAATKLRKQLSSLDAVDLVELEGPTHADAIDVAVLVHAAADEPRAELAQLREHTGAPVVLATTAASSGLVRWALEADIADVLSLPAAPENVHFVVEKAAQAARLLESGSGE